MIWSRNVIERFVWTFVQAAIGSLGVVNATAAVTGGHLGALRVIGLTALGAGVAAVLSLAKNLTAEGIVVQSAKRTDAVIAKTAAPLVLTSVTTAAPPVTTFSHVTLAWPVTSLTTTRPAPSTSLTTTRPAPSTPPTRKRPSRAKRTVGE